MIKHKGKQMKSHCFFLMGIILFTSNTQAMNNVSKKTYPFLERLAKANAEWQKRNKTDKNNDKKIYDTFELEKIKKLTNQKN